jgi:hypothetical protein
VCMSVLDECVMVTLILMDTYTVVIRPIRVDHTDFFKWILKLMHHYPNDMNHDYILTLCDFYSYRLIGKLTDFFQFQEFNLHKTTVVSSTYFGSLVSRLYPPVIFVCPLGG